MHHCSDEALLAHLDAELDRAEDKAVAAHLATCWSCRNRLALLEQQIHTLVDTAERGDFPGPLWRRRAGAVLQNRIAALEQGDGGSGVPRGPIFRRTAWITSLGFAALGALMGVLLLMPARIEGKATLLKSVEAERRALGGLRARRRTWDVEQYAGGKLLARRKVEHWQGENAVPAALRVFDEQHLLVAGEWVAVNGTRTRYRRGSAPLTVNGAAPESASLPQDLDEACLLPLSAQAFLSLVGNDPKTEVRKTEGNLVVEVNEPGAATALAGPALAHASLVLSGEGLRPTGGVLRVRYGVGETEYRLNETGLERYLDRTPPAHVFERDLPEPAPLPATPAKSPAIPQVAGETHPVPALPEAANPGLEVAILRQLTMENVTLGENGRLLRNPDGTPDLHLRVTSEEKRSRLETALATLHGVSPWTSRIEVAPEEPEPLTPDPRLFLRWASEKVASEGAGAGPGRVEQLANEQSSRLAASLRRMRNHALAVRNTGGRFRPGELERLDEEQRQEWKTTVFRQIRALQTEMVLVEQGLQRISGGNGTSPGSPPATGDIALDAVTSQVEAIYRMARSVLLNGTPAKVADVLTALNSCRTSIDLLAADFEPQ